MNVEYSANHVPQEPVNREANRGLRVAIWSPYLRFETSEGQQEVSLRRLCCLSFYNLESPEGLQQVSMKVSSVTELIRLSS